MIKRYTRPEMGEIWSAENRFNCLLEVELAVAFAQAKLKIIPEKAFKDLKSKAKFSVKRIDEIEKTVIEATLDYTGGDKSHAARLLNIGRKTLYRKLEQYELDAS